MRRKRALIVCGILVAGGGLCFWVNHELATTIWTTPVTEKLSPDGGPNKDPPRIAWTAVIVRPPLKGFPPSATAGPGFQWRGRPGSKSGDPNGNWFNPETGATLRPDLGHPRPFGPHYDYRAPDGRWYRRFPNGEMLPKG